MDTRYLDYIITLSKTQNMTQAAELLYVTQSSLSQFLSKLEKDIGTPLFLRTKGALIPTPAGQLYIAFAENVIAQKKELYKKIDSLHNTGHIAVGVTSKWGMSILSDCIPAFKKIYPNVTIELFNDTVPPILKLLTEGSIDFALVSLSSTDVFQDETTILKKEDVLFAVPGSHSFCAKHSGDTIYASDAIQMIKESNLLLAKKGSSLRFVCDDFFASNHYEPVSMCEMNVIDAMQQMIEAGNGVAFIGASCVEPEQNIHYYKVDPPLYRYNVLLHCKDMQFSDSDLQFTELIKNYYCHDFPRK